MNQLKNQTKYKDIINDKASRRMLGERLAGFCSIYLPHYFTLKSAPFQLEMMELLENKKERFIEILAFRESAKSTLSMVAFPLWGALQGEYQFIILITSTFSQIKSHIANLKYEMDSNKLVREDFGNIQSDEEWTTTNMLLANGARIIGRSTGQKIRGIRHRQFRPDLIIIDDPESLEDVVSKEQRDKVEKWLRGEVMPALDKEKGRLIILGNLLHTDSLLSRIKNDKIFLTKEYPLLNNKEEIQWLGKYPTMAEIEKQKLFVKETSWQREYLLKIVPEEGQEIKEEWIQRYEKLPSENLILGKAIGVDLAISKKETANYTAMVSGIVVRESEMPKIYILPHSINARLSFHETILQAESCSEALGGNTGYANLIVEEVAYQKAAIEEMQKRMLPVQGIKVTMDKRARLRTISGYIQNGTILFPHNGCEDLLIQLLGFGIEEYDDLVDAFVLLTSYLKDYIIKKTNIEEIENKKNTFLPVLKKVF